MCVCVQMIHSIKNNQWTKDDNCYCYYKQSDWVSEWGGIEYFKYCMYLMFIYDGFSFKNYPINQFKCCLLILFVEMHDTVQWCCSSIPKLFASLLIRMSDDDLSIILCYFFFTFLFFFFFRLLSVFLFFSTFLSYFFAQ